MLLIRYRNVPAALVADGTVHLLAGAPGSDGPHLRWVLCMAFFAHDVATRRVPGPYTVERAEHFARHVLMPDGKFHRFAELPDDVVADVFEVPFEQVEEKRLDVAAQEWLHAAQALPGRQG